MTLRKKLLLAQLPLAIALVFVGFTAVSKVASIGRRSEIILKDNYRSVLAAQRMKEVIERLHDLAVLSLLGARDESGEAWLDQIRRFELQLVEGEANVTEIGEPEILKELRSSWQAYHEHLQRLANLPVEGDDRGARLNELDAAFAAVRDKAQGLLDINQDAMTRKSDRAQREARRAETFMVSAAILALILGALLSSMAARRLLQPFELLTRTVTRLGEGDFEARVDVGGRDEVAQLADDINAMAIHLSQFKRSSLGELLLAQEASQAAIDSLPDPVVVFDLDGSILNLNRAAETLLGLSVDAQGGAVDTMPEAVRECLERVRGHVLSGKGAYVPRGFEEAVRVATAAGEHYLLPRATAVHSEEGGVTGATVVLQDVTRLRRVDDLRNNLVSTVAHELRTPLTSLRMAIHLCLERVGGPLTEKQADLLYAAREECERLQAIVDELLDLARIQSGRIELHRIATAPRSVISTAVDAQRGLAESKHLVVQQELPAHLPDAWVDRERVQLVLANFLTNAIRHTPAGGRITVRASAADGESIRFDVTDGGPGVPAEYRATIFERFVRVPETQGGAGLGLSIAKEVVEAHGGLIGVEDGPEGGARFWFTVPVAASEESRLVHQPSERYEI